MSDINKKGIWETFVFHELYGLNIGKTVPNASYIYIPTMGQNSSINPYYVLFSDFGLGEKVRIIMEVSYEGFDTSNTDGSFNIRFQGAKRNDDGTNDWTGANEITSALNNYQNLKDVVLSQTNGVFIYDTTFIVSENFYNTYVGCNIGIRSDYSNGIGKITMHEPIIFPDKYYINTDSIIRQSDNFLSCMEIIEY